MSLLTKSYRRKKHYRRIAVNSKPRHMVPLYPDRMHIITSQTIEGILRCTETMCGVCIRMDTLFNDNATAASQWTGKMFNNDNGVTCTYGGNQLDGFAIGAEVGQIIAGQIYNNAWVSRADYSLSYQRMNTPGAPGDIDNTTKLLYLPQDNIWAAMCPLTSYQAVELRSTQTGAGLPNTIFPGSTDGQIWSNTLRQRYMRVTRIAGGESGPTAGQLSGSYSLKKFSLPGYPLSSGLFWNKILVADPAGPSIPSPPYLWIGFRQDRYTSMTDISTDPPTAVLPILNVKFQLRIKLHVTCINKRLQTRVYSSLAQDDPPFDPPPVPDGAAEVVWPYSNATADYVPNPE